MRFELMSLGGNVIRFPVELRAKPSIALLLELASDLGEVTLIAEAFGLDAPDPEARDRADRTMAETIGLTIFPVNETRAAKLWARCSSRRLSAPWRFARRRDRPVSWRMKRAREACGRANRRGLLACASRSRSGDARCRSSASADRRA
jgi:hypothetical protein